MNKLLIATNNKGKVEELQDLLKDTGIDLLTPAQINLQLDVVEDGNTYAENATKKAIAFAKASELISLADDSGLEVDALDGAPGLYSARYSRKPNATDIDRRAYLLQNLKDKPRPWIARFHATIAIATLWSPTDLLSDMQEQAPALQSFWSPTDLLSDMQKRATALQIFEGICEGEIIPAERGTGGFGYDPIFLFPELGKTMAELRMDEKNRLSHRARAVMKAKTVLSRIFS